jgi:hypothetical protein
MKSKMSDPPDRFERPTSGSVCRRSTAELRGSKGDLQLAATCVKLFQLAQVDFLDSPFMR